MTPSGGTDESDCVTITGDAVRTITFQRPEQSNAITLEVQRRLLDVLDEIARDPGVCAIVVTGAGRSFSAGGDFALIRAIQLDLTMRRETLELARRLFRRFMSLEVPMVAAVNGPAVGAGCTIALLCDVLFMAEDAFLADPRVRIGLVPGDGATLVWSNSIGLPAAFAYLLSGERLGAHDAHRIGLAHRVVAAGDVLEEAMQFATRIATFPRGAVRATKRLLSLDMPLAEAQLDLAIQAEFDSVDDVGLPEEGMGR